MKYLGIDYGTKRIGLAFSESGGLALPHSVIPAGNSALQAVTTLMEEKGVTEVVIGESLDYRNEPNAVMKDIARFAEMLRKKGYTVHLEREFLTSRASEHIQGKTDMIDASAAALILQSFLDKKK